VGRLDRPDTDQERKEQVQAAYAASHKIYGYRRIGLWLEEKRNLQINHKAVLRLMQELGIRSRARRRKMYRKLEESGIFHKYDNVLNRDFTATRSNQKWVTDITYVMTQDGWAYLSVIKDLYDGFIVAYAFDRNNSIALVTRTIRQAMQKEKVTDGLILHSDQGHQYTSQAYHDVLVNEYNIFPSMSRRGNCWDNACIENFFGHLKEEYLRHFKNPTFAEASQMIAEYIYFYNYERIQLKTRQTPFERRCLST
jgi:transposase InsO family protein